MTAYRVEQPGRPQPAEIPAARRASHVIYLRVNPLPLLSYPEPLQSLQPHHSHLLQLSPGWPFPFLSIGIMSLTTDSHCISKQPFLGDAAIRACQEQMFATQTQHTAILRQIQHHLGIISPLEHSIPIPPEPSQALLLYIKLCLLRS
ncbi:hypothetical protein CK203_114096 [Vitis vinifera]|uniref:Uncharacterized protein n=1 Tax=Vitis vinifera TaxID=29760 RepID=A0A438CRJ0_VITVI|nr:hypothetical protein CK203_114096 [Vitis vinifera]